MTNKQLAQIEQKIKEKYPNSTFSLGRDSLHITFNPNEKIYKYKGVNYLDVIAKIGINDFIYQVDVWEIEKHITDLIKIRENNYIGFNPFYEDKRNPNEIKQKIKDLQKKIDGKIII